MTQNANRTAKGTFTLKSDSPRKMRAANLTDEAWEWLKLAADALQMTRNDFIEELARQHRYPFTEADSTAELKLRCEALEAENRVLKGQLDTLSSKTANEIGDTLTQNELMASGLFTRRDLLEMKKVGDRTKPSKKDGSVWEVQTMRDPSKNNSKVYVRVI